MINYTALGRRRVSVAITASYDAPTEAVKAACWDAINATENVLQDPAPAVVLTNYGSSSIEYTILCWTESGNFLGVKNGINEKLRETYAAHNHTIVLSEFDMAISRNWKFAPPTYANTICRNFYIIFIYFTYYNTHKKLLSLTAKI
jgi:small conductance mechanosensitive channel